VTSSDVAERDTASATAAGAEPVGLRVARNSVYNLAAFVYPVLITLVLTPLILHFVGHTDYGIFALSSIFVSFLGLLDFGMSPSVTKFVSERVAVDETSAAGRIVSVSILFYGLVGILGAAASLLMAFVVLPQPFNLAAADLSTARFVFAVAGADFFLTMLINPLLALPGSLQRYDVTARITILLTTVTAIASVVTLAAGYGIEGLAVVSTAEPLLGLIVLMPVLRSLMPSLRLRPRWDPRLLRSLFAFSGYTFIANVTGAFLLQFDKFALGAFQSVTAVTYYVVPGNVAQRLHAGTASLTGVLLPAASGMYARGDENAVRRLYVRATKFTLLFLLALTLPAIVFAREVLLYWLGESFAIHSFWALRLLVLTYFMLSLSAIPYFVALARGRPQLAGIFSGVTALLNVVLVLVLVPRYGVNGAAVAFLLSMATVPPSIWYVERRVLRMDVRVWGRLARRFAAPVLLDLAACLVLRPLAVDLPVLLLILVATVATLPLACYATGFFDAQDRALIASFIRRSRKAAA
jgi:O-antigen/teichoic acid export membrane protein